VQGAVAKETLLDLSSAARRRAALAVQQALAEPTIPLCCLCLGGLGAYTSSVPWIPAGGCPHEHFPANDGFVLARSPWRSCSVDGRPSAAAESKDVKDVVVSKDGPTEFRFDFGILVSSLVHFQASLEATGITNDDRPIRTIGRIFRQVERVFAAGWPALQPLDRDRSRGGHYATKTRDGVSAMWVFGYRGNLILNLTTASVPAFVLVGMAP